MACLEAVREKKRQGFGEWLNWAKDVKDLTWELQKKIIIDVQM